MSTKELLAFSEAQQYAVIGHMLQYVDIWDTLQAFGVNEKWLTSPPLHDFFKHLAEYKKQFDRLPASKDEILDFIFDEMQKGAAERALAQCVASKKKYPWDVLERKLSEWAKSRITFVVAKNVYEKYNAGKHEEAQELLKNAAVDLQKIDAASGMEPDGFKSAVERIKGEKERRAEDVKRSIRYSIQYLQDATGGILPTEVVLWGATSGAGKTEAAKIQAAYTAKTLQEPVHYFALEAEPDEIERRIKYGIMGGMYREEHSNIPRGKIGYANYRKNRLIEELDPYEKYAEDIFERDYKHLHTYYLKRGDFNVDTLKREMWKLKGNSRLILLDHIHFLDIEGNNETKEQSESIKGIRKMAIAMEVPVIIIAHITEKGIRHGELIPRREDFYGASNLFKTAQTAIMMAPVHGLASSDPRTFGVPTFMRIVKGRLDNSLQYFPGISFFNVYKGDYTPYYSVGQLSKGNKKWASLKEELPNWVNIENNCPDVNDIE
jgi:replicative DNA helicase